MSENPQHIDVTYQKMRAYFCAAERQHQHLTGYIVFTQTSFEKEYPLESRTYIVSSANKAFQPNMGGYYIYASSLDGTDPIIRLERYMAIKHGGKTGWQIERCYMTSDELNRAKELLKKERDMER